MSAKRAFVQVDGAVDGIGKLFEIDGNLAHIEYFESPAGPRLQTRHVPVASVREVELSPQTRIFWIDPAHQHWIAGRVDGGLVSAQALRTTEDHYHVRFPNGDERRVPISELFVRWAHPIQDPSDYLGARIVDTPYFFDGRSRIVRHIASQRAAFGGLTALASSAIELLEHQVTIVRRVLADPVERYLLADEVGLGKTIEAGILIRQHVIDAPRHARVAIIVPEHLESQWRSELATKFFLASDAVVRVVPECALLDNRLATFDPTMLVVDEAHRIARKAFDADVRERHAYEQLSLLTSKTPRLLLLSGTPVLHQEDGFLAMLHLLDPAAYPLDGRESFHRRILERQAIAEAIADLTDDASSLFAEDAINRLEAAFGDDERLNKLSSIARSQLSIDIQHSPRILALRALRTHVVETYRLHRRLLRTRRGDPRVELLLPSRNGLLIVDHHDQGRIEAFNFLEAWRLSAHDADEMSDGGDSMFAILVEAALSHPIVLLRHLDSRLRSRSSTSFSTDAEAQSQPLDLPWAFDGEQSLLEQYRELIAATADREYRAVRLAEWLRANRDVVKCVVFVTDCAVADVVANTLREELSSWVVLRYLGEPERADAFVKSGQSTILVCDSNAEEGLNLQRCGATIVHYDLPLESARVEQRIGRVDRIEARGRMRNVAFSATNPYEREWLACLIGAVRVFDRSVAPLQYALAESASRIRSDLKRKGPNAIDDETARLSDSAIGLQAELRRIDAQEAIDAIDLNPERDAEFFRALVDSDEVIAVEGEAALNSWVTDRLRFIRRSVGPGVIRYLHDTRHPTLVPVMDTVTNFRSLIETAPEFRKSRSIVALQPVTFDRATAETATVPLLRVGHLFLQAMESMIRSDDRGTAFAMWRYVPRSVRVPRLFLRFDFFVEAAIAPLERFGDFDTGSGPALRRRADDAFPVSYRTVWLTSDLGEVTNPKVVALLMRPYSKQPRPDGARDVNLRPDRWERAARHVSFGDWPDLCARARDAAEQVVRNSAAFRDTCEMASARLRQAAGAVSTALASRIERADGAAREADCRIAQLESEITEAIVRGIESPSLRLDSTGVVIVASAPLEEE